MGAAAAGTINASELSAAVGVDSILAAQHGLADDMDAVATAVYATVA